MSNTEPTAPERDPAAVLLSLDAILVTSRHRKTLVNIEGLAKSIVEVGLMSPVLVKEIGTGYKLLAGERRLRAFESLGLAEIPARIAYNVSDARDALVAERDENTQREPMLPSETASLGMEIEALEKPAAAERRNEALNKGESRSVRANGTGHESREIAADAIGMSTTTFARMKTIINTAADENAPEDVRETAREAVDAIDTGAAITPAYGRVIEARKKSEPTTVETVPRRTNDPTEYLRALAILHPTARIAFELDGKERYANHTSFESAAHRVGVEWRFNEKKWKTRIATSVDVLDRSTMSLEAALAAIAERVDFTTITTEQATESLQRLDVLALNRIIKKLKEISNEY